MGRIGITYDQVANCANKITATGQQPTVERIRVLLKKGSHSTIGKYLREWRMEQDQPVLATYDKLPDELIALLKGLWERVVHQAQEKIDAASLACDQKLEQHQKLVQELQNEAVQLKQAKNSLEQERELLKKEKVTLEETLSRASRQLVALETKEEALLKQLTDKRSYIEELHKQNQQTQANLEHYRAASLEERQLERLRQEQQQHELTQTITFLKQENKIYEIQQIEQKRLNQQLEFKQQALQEENTTLFSQIEDISTQLSGANIALTQSMQSQQHWQQQYEVLVNKCEQYLQDIIDLKSKHAVLSQQLIILQADLQNVNQLNKCLVEEKWVLNQEKSQLYGQLLQLQESS